MFNVDTATKKITLHRGDTGRVPFRVTGYTFESGDVVLFTAKSPNGTELIRHVYTLDENGGFVVEFPNSLTDGAQPGQYQYDARVAILPEYNGQGELVDVDFEHGGAVCTPETPLIIEILGTVGQI